MIWVSRDYEGGLLVGSAVDLLAERLASVEFSAREPTGRVCRVEPLSIGPEAREVCSFFEDEVGVVPGRDAVVGRVGDHHCAFEQTDEFLHFFFDETLVLCGFVPRDVVSSFFADFSHLVCDLGHRSDADSVACGVWVFAFVHVGRDDCPLLLVRWEGFAGEAEATWLARWFRAW